MTMRPLFFPPSLLLLGSIVLLAATSQLSAQAFRDPDEKNFRVTPVAALNSAKDDYGPFVTANGQWLYLTSGRDGESDLYRAPRQGAGWGKPVRVPTPGTTQGVLAGALSPISQLHDLDETLLKPISVPEFGLVTRSIRNGRRWDGDLYGVRISKDGSNITTIGSLTELNTSDWESQPTLAPDGSFIIFSSLRKGGRGGKDLYISVRRGDGTLAPPVNLGARINSSGDDVSPFIAPDGRTLFFSSDRAGGFGGSDIYVSRQNAVGEWGEPRNLGSLINSSANELFFFAMSRRACYFASDRPGGQGGLDIYEGSPNIFAPGYALLQVSLRDSVRRVGVAGNLKVVEKSSGRTFGDIAIDPEAGATIPVLAGYSYSVTVKAGTFGDSSYTLAGFKEGEVIAQRLEYGVPVARPVPPTPPDEKPVFARDLVGIDIPLFVSGYYRINTPELLADLRRRQSSGDLRERTYITDVAGDQRTYAQYLEMATRVEKTIQAFYTRAVGEYFPAYLAERAPDEFLEMTVYGFADPRPIVGIYSEPAVDFLDSLGRTVIVSPGDSLDNFKLAGLRARYAADYFDAMFSAPSGRGNEAYRRLKSEGRVRWRAVSGSVAQSGGGDLSEQRRIRVEFRREKESGSLR